MEQILNFIGGEFLPPKEEQYLDVINPATGQVYAKLPASTAEDVALAVDSARNAFAGWAGMTIANRSKILHRLATLIEENLDTLAKAESIDNGKPLALAKAIDIPRAASNFRFFASAIVNESTQAHVMENEAVNYSRRKPLGIVGCISPWNLPLYLFSWKIAPALATGNCVIAKPSEVTPMTAHLLGELCAAAGIPPGVLNILHGYGHEVGKAIVAHPEIKAISFTGGTATGKAIASTAAPMFKKLSLELGGKNPTVIFDDCDYDNMLPQVVKSSFTNQGEICLCGSRLLVHASMYERFVRDFTLQVSKLTVGNPLLPHDLGAIVSQAHLEKIAAYVALAKAEGGKIVTGGNRLTPAPPNEQGYFFEPTVITGLSNQCRTNQEEIFGPVVSIIPFETTEDAIALANDTQYGLSVSIWTGDVKKAHQVAHKIEAGVVWVNCWLLRDLRTPFGGMKASGVGREGGDEALRFFTELQNICIRM